MNFARIKQLYSRRDRLQEMIDAQTDEITAYAKEQLDLERKAYAEVFGPQPERDPKNYYNDAWKWQNRMCKISRYLDPHLYLKLSEYSALEIECWSRGCRGGSDERETTFKLDERMASEEGRAAMYTEFVEKYKTMKREQEQQARADIEAERRRLEERLRQLGGN